MPENNNTNNDKSLESWIWDAACSIRGAKDAAKTFLVRHPDQLQVSFYLDAERRGCMRLNLFYASK